MSFPIAQCLEHPTGVRVAMGSIPVRYSELYFVRSHARDNCIFHLSYSFPSLNFPIFLSLLSRTVLSTLLIPAVCMTRVTTNLVNMTSLATSLPVVRAPDRCTGGHGFDSRPELRFAFCPTLLETENYIVVK